MNLADLHPNALAAAMRGGTEGWGQVGGLPGHIRYWQPVKPASRRRCHCGCKQRATRNGMCNGVCLTTACELAIARWIKTGNTRAKRSPWGNPQSETPPGKGGVSVNSGTE